MDPQNDEDHELPQVELSDETDDSNKDVVQQAVQKTTQPTAQSAQPQAAQQVSVSDPAMVADDVDLIEKEWVNKAKNIVKSTVGDPHVQNEQISQIKVDYMKKRYGRDVKVGE